MIFAFYITQSRRGCGGPSTWWDLVSHRGTENTEFFQAALLERTGLGSFRATQRSSQRCPPPSFACDAFARKNGEGMRLGKV